MVPRSIEADILNVQLLMRPFFITGMHGKMERPRCKRHPRFLHAGKFEMHPCHQIKPCSANQRFGCPSYSAVPEPELMDDGRPK